MRFSFIEIAVIVFGVLLLIDTLRNIIKKKPEEVNGWGVIESIKKTSFEKGDVLFITTEANLTMQQIATLREDINRSLPEGVKPVLLEGGLQLSVLTKGEVLS
jgi:hypothetical protein